MTLIRPRFSKWLQFSMSIARKFWSPATTPKQTKNTINWMVKWNREKKYDQFPGCTQDQKYLSVPTIWERERENMLTYDLWFAYGESYTINQLSGGVECIAEMLLCFLVLLYVPMLFPCPVDGATKCHKKQKDEKSLENRRFCWIFCRFPLKWYFQQIVHLFNNSILFFC